MSSPLEVFANSSGYLSIKFNRNHLASGTNLAYAQIVTSIEGLKMGDNYTSLRAAANSVVSQPPESDFTRPSANKAAIQVIMERNAAVKAGVEAGKSHVGQLTDQSNHAAGIITPNANTTMLQDTPSVKVGDAVTLPTTNGGTIDTGNMVRYPYHYYIVGYNSDKQIMYISPEPCRDPSDQYFELVSKEGKFELGWDNTHCWYYGYVALYKYSPAIGGDNGDDIKAYNTYQWSTKGNSYSTGYGDDNAQWYAALCTWDYSKDRWTVVKVIGVVESVQLYDFKYANLEPGALSTSQQQVFTAIASNGGDESSPSTPSQSFSLEESYTWSVDVGVKIGVKVTASTGVPILGQGEIETSIEFSFNWSTSTTNTKTQTVSLTQSLDVKPHTKHIIKFQSVIGQVENLKYTAKVKVLCRGDEKFESHSRDMTGQYTGAVSNRIMVEVGAAQPFEPSPPTPNKLMVDVDDGHAGDANPSPHQVHDANGVVQVIADDNAVGGSPKDKVHPFPVTADAIYWYYVDPKSTIHQVSGGI